MDFKDKIRNIPDFPEKGVIFRDISPLLEDPKTFQSAIDYFVDQLRHKRIDKIVGVDARGFLLAGILAHRLGTGLVMIRKQGKLPGSTVSEEFNIEYATRTLEIQRGAINPGEKVVIVDDVLATGGTLQAAVNLVEKLGGWIDSLALLITLNYLPGKEKLKNYNIISLVEYSGDEDAKPIPSETKVGIIGGSGFYNLIDNLEEVQIDTPYGAPSSAVGQGTIAGRQVAFLSRHDKNHTIPPHRVNYLANIWALKELGVTGIIAINAVGSLQKHIEPGDFVVLDQFVDRTEGRKDTFYNGPAVTHVSTAFPYCPQLRQLTINKANELGIKAHQKGTAVVIQGPRFSTAAESAWFTKMDWSVINMTQYPEVALAREKEMCYCAIAMATDYDAGLITQNSIAPASVEEVVRVAKQNVGKAKKLVVEIIRNWPNQTTCTCHQALKGARF